MAKKKTRSDIKVYWEDAVIYGAESKSSSLKPSRKITTGILLQENKEFILIGKPRTLVMDPKTGNYKIHNQSAGAAYFYIPQGMITYRTASRK